jgi:hypothetical protein
MGRYILSLRLGRKGNGSLKRLGNKGRSEFCFLLRVVDDSSVVLFQLHPNDKDRILSVVKIWNAGLAKISVRNSIPSGNGK